eukprot:UN01954
MLTYFPTICTSRISDSVLAVDLSSSSYQLAKWHFSRIIMGLFLF